MKIHINLIKAFFRRLMPKFYGLYCQGYRAGYECREMKTLPEFRKEILEAVEERWKGGAVCQ